MPKIPDPTFRDLALASLEKINSLCQRPDWLSTRREILEFSHGMHQDLSLYPTNEVLFSNEELDYLYSALVMVKFSPNITTQKCDELISKIHTIIEERKKKQ